MRRVFAALLPLLCVAACATSGAGASGGSGGSGSTSLDARYVAVHNALASTGWSEVGPLQRAVVSRGAETRLPVNLRAPCTTVVLFGSPGAGALDAKVVDPTGKLLARAETVDGSPVIKACVADAGTYTLVISAPSAGGSGGEVLAAEFAGDTGSVPPKPATDGTCAAPFPLSDGRTAGNTSHGHSELEGSCASSQGKELVYRLELKERKKLTVEVDPKFDAVLYLRKEACAEDDSEVTCNDDFGGERHSRIEEELDPGVYFVIVDGYGNESGAFKMDVTESAAEPVSMACAHAPELVAGVAMNASWAEESNHAVGSCQHGGSGADAMYRWHETKTERVRFTLDAKDGERAALFVRRACTDEDSEVACEVSGANGDTSTSRLLTPGDYVLFADAIGARPGNDFTVQAETAPAEGAHVAGDSCGDALPVAAGDVVRGDTFAARDDGAQSCGGEGAADLVYRIEVPVRSFLDVGLSWDSSMDAVLSVSRGCGARRQEVACGAGDSVAMVVDPGSWFVTVDGRTAEDLGAFQLRVDLRDVRAQEQVCKSPPLLAPGKVLDGTTRGARDAFLPSCAQPPRRSAVRAHHGAPSPSSTPPPPAPPPPSNPDRVFRIVVKQRATVRAWVSGDGWDPVLALRSTCLDTPHDAELACDADAGQDGKRSLEETVDPGTYFLVVDGQGPDSAGKFHLQYTASPAQDPPPGVVK